jgi:hypothetical protein
LHSNLRRNEARSQQGSKRTRKKNKNGKVENKEFKNNAATMKRTTIIEIIIILYAILFLYTGISKLIDYSVFKEQLAESPLFGHIAKPVALILPSLEFAVIFALILPKWRLKGFYTALVLMIGFTSYVAGLLLYDDKLPCSCGGIIQQLSWPQHLVFNGAFIALAVIGIVLQKKVKKNSTPSEEYRITNVKYRISK